MATRPNILFVLTDQQSIRAMSCSGNRFCHTPHMDRIAAAGVRFEKSYCSSPVCGPARATFETGRMPHDAGVDFNGESVHSHVPTMGEIFRAAGYYTVWSGKHHVPYLYPKPHKGQFLRGFDYLPLPNGIPFPNQGDRVDGIATDMACHWLQTEAPQQQSPWLMTVSLHNPHDICGYTRRTPVTHAHVGDYPALPENADILHDDIDFIRTCRRRDHYGPENRNTDTWDDNQWRAYLHEYGRLTEQADTLLGQLLDTLDSTGLSDNTIVIFTSDHGEGMAEHRWVVKLMFWESVVSVPLLIRWPNHVPAGRVDSEHLASGLDILPTMCDYAGIDHPEFTGRSLKAVIDNPDSDDWRDYLVTELAPDPDDRSLLGRMVRSNRYKYCVFNRGKSREMLFDMDADPGETRNLAGDPAMRDIVQQHRRWLSEWSAAIHDPFDAALPTR